MLLDEVWPFIEKSENQLALMKAFKLPVSFYRKQNEYDEFFSSHTAVKVLTNDINAPLYVLMCAQLMELNKGMRDLSWIVHKTYNDTDTQETNGVRELEAQYVLLNHLWEQGTKIFTKFLQYNGGEVETQNLRDEILEYRKSEVEIYTALKSYQPFKIHNLHEYFIQVPSSLKNDKEEFSAALKGYNSLVVSMRCFSTFVNLLPQAIRLPSSKNYLAMAFAERMEINTVTSLDDEKMMHYFLPTINDVCLRNLEKEVAVTKNYHFVGKFNEFKKENPHLIDTKQEELFFQRNKGKKEEPEYLYCFDLKEDDWAIIEKQMLYIKNNTAEKDFKSLKAKPKDFVLLNRISLKGWEEKVDKADLHKAPFAKYMSMINGASIIAEIYENYIKKSFEFNNDNIIRVDSVSKERRIFIEKELKSIQGSLMFGNNVKYMKDLFALRANGEELNKKLQMFYVMRKNLNDEQVDSSIEVDKLTKIRCFTKGMEFVLEDMHKLIEQDLRYMKLKAVTSEKKERKTARKKL